MEDLKQCLLCYYNSLSNTGDSWVNVTRGLENIIHCSKQRADGLNEKLFEVDSLKVHVGCQKVYTDRKRIAIVKKRKITDDSDADKPRSVIADRRRRRFLTLRKTACFVQYPNSPWFLRFVVVWIKLMSLFQIVELIGKLS